MGWATWASSRPDLPVVRDALPNEPHENDSADWADLALRGRWSVLLNLVLERWREHPNVLLAEVAVALGAKVSPKPDIIASTWDEAAAAVNSEALTALLATVGSRGSKVARDRLEVLAGWHLDPRFDRWVAEQFANPPLTSRGARPYWTRLQPFLRRVRDTKALATLVEARRSYRAANAHEDFMSSLLDRVLPELMQVREVPLGNDARAELGVVMERLEASKGAVLGHLERLLEDPLAATDHSLGVLADALTEQGDPRGELITLQLDPSPDAKKLARIDQLTHDSWAELVGPLDGAIKPEAEFKRGFLSRVSLKQGNAAAIAQAIKRSAGHPLWATVEHLEGPGDAPLTTHAVMRSLKSILNSDVPLEALARLRRLERCHTQLTTELDWSNPALFPSLRQLVGTGTVEAVNRLLKAPRFLLRLDQWRLVVHEVPSGFPVAYLDGVVEPGGLVTSVWVDRLTSSSYFRPSQVEVCQRVIDSLAALEPARLVLRSNFHGRRAADQLAAQIRELGGLVELA